MVWYDTDAIVSMMLLTVTVKWDIKLKNKPEFDGKPAGECLLRHARTHAIAAAGHLCGTLFQSSCVTLTPPSQVLPKVYTHTRRHCSFIQYGLNHYQQTYFFTMVSIWLFVLLLATLYDHMIMYVGIFGHSAVVFFLFYWLFVFFVFSDILLIYSAV